jgi:D-serine deaminase-like pyridoxal phosphate-dependent protein
VTTIHDLTTPALVIESKILEQNLAAMAKALPGPRLRPHVKAHKCTAIAGRQLAHGHEGFTCATTREVLGLAAAGLSSDLLLANEVLDPRRLRAIARLDARVSVAVDSAETIDAAAKAGIQEVLIDVNVGLPRCGCRPEDAGHLAELARKRGLEVRGVMGYEGHLMGIADGARRAEGCEAAMQLLLAAHAGVGGEVISAGGTGTYLDNHWASEIQAGSYALMDTTYAELELPFVQALWVWATVISVSEKYAVADCGLKSLGMDHGNSRVVDGKVWFFSDEHVTFAPQSPVEVGARVRIVPAHIDPTVAYHELIHVCEGEEVVDQWPVDLRGW